MRLAVVSDIHGNLPALDAVVRDIARRSVDQVVNLGDNLSGPLYPLETAQFLMAQGWVHLAGNHERQLLTLGPGQRGLSDDYAHGRLSQREFDWLASLVPSARLSPDVWLCHGTPRNDGEYFLESVDAGGSPASLASGQTRAATALEVADRLGEVDAELILCGHTHVPRAMRAPSGQLIVNPGSVGLQAYDDTHPHPHVVATGSPDARYAIVERVSGGWAASLITVPYDHAAVATLAAARGRADWAMALATGRLDSVI